MTQFNCVFSAKYVDDYDYEKLQYTARVIAISALIETTLLLARRRRRRMNVPFSTSGMT